MPVTSGPLEFEVRVPRDGIVPLMPGMPAYEGARRQLLLFIEESDRGQWWGTMARIDNRAYFYDPGLGSLRDAELAAARAWLDYSLFYQGSGLPGETAQREFARQMTRRVYQYVD
jgi:hypothetical protein